jgi:biopolymer transport protein TolR
MAMSAGGSASVQSTPNVTPMIDVMLVLLIIFMVVTPMLLSGFTADPPIAINLKDHPEDDQLDQVLGIDSKGRYYLNKIEIPYENIGPKLKQIYDARTEDKIMYLKADSKLDYEKVLDIMDLAAKQGVRMVALISDQKPNTVSTVPGDTKATAPPGGATPPAAPPGGNH